MTLIQYHSSRKVILYLMSLLSQRKKFKASFSHIYILNLNSMSLKDSENQLKMQSVRVNDVSQVDTVLQQKSEVAISQSQKDIHVSHVVDNYDDNGDVNMSKQQQQQQIFDLTQVSHSEIRIHWVAKMTLNGRSILDTVQDKASNLKYFQG